MKVLYRVGHAGRNSRKNDPGAVAKVGGVELREVDCAFIMAKAAFDAAKAAGHHSFLSAHMEYPECHNWAVRSGVNVYVACHVNTNPDPDLAKGMFFFHEETSAGNGDRLAALMAEEMSRLGEELLGRPYECVAKRASSKDWTADARYTIKKFGRDVRGIGICGEPYMMTHRQSLRTFSQPKNLSRIGVEVYDRSITRWERGEQPEIWRGDRQP